MVPFPWIYHSFPSQVRKETTCCCAVVMQCLCDAHASTTPNKSLRLRHLHLKRTQK